MEAGRSFTSIFPISQSQIILPRSQQALRKQDQMRKREVHLQNQLQCICQRQRDAHRRNQDLLRDFKRIEQDLCLITAKSDSFRRKQEKYKKHMYSCISGQSKYPAPNTNMSSMGHSYTKQLNDFSEANYVNLCEPCHLSASVGHVVQSSTHFGLCPNQQLELQECYNRSLCCDLLHPHCDEQFESFIQDSRKISDSTLDCQSQKKKYCTSDSSTPRNIMFNPNSKSNISQRFPGFACDKDSSLKGRAMPSHIHGDLLQFILSSDMYSNWKEKILNEMQQQMVGDHAVETTVEKSKEDSRKRQASNGDSPNFFSEYPQKHLDALSKLHLHSVSPPIIDHDTKYSLKSASKKKTKQAKAVYECTPCDVTAEQNIDDALYKEQETSKVGRHEMKLSLKLSNALDSLVGIEVKEQTSNYKENSSIGKNQCKPEIKTIDSSEAERISEDGSHPDPKYSCPAGYFHQCENEKDICFLDTFLKRSLEESVDSSEQENAPPEGSKMIHIVQENENSGRCRVSDEHSQEEASVSSRPSIKKTGSSDSRSSDKRLEIEQQSLFGEMVQHNQSLCAANSFVINEDTMKGMMTMYMSKQESESDEESEGQMQEMKCKDANVGLLKGDRELASQGLLENNKTGDIYAVVGDSEKFREMLTEEIEKSSSVEEGESEEESKETHERVCMFTLKEIDMQKKVNVNEESAIDDPGEDRTSGEDELSVNDSQGSPIIIMDALIHGTTKKEQSNAESNKENKLTKKRGNQEESNPGNNIISEDETTDKTNISDEEKLSSEDLDVSDEIDSPEEEENTDFWGSIHEDNDTDIENTEKDVQSQGSSITDSSKQVTVDVSAREEDPQEPDVTAVSCQNLIEDEEVNSEKQRSNWLCCLKTCPLPHILNKSEHQPQGKRCSEDGSINMLHLHPVEFVSSLPAEETPADSIANVHTDTASAAETNADDSEEESLHGEKESENHHQPWSDSKDNVHSFYD
ncbi:uncharacterized protein ACMZJ9_016767 [Mantella aurantiaca]